LSSLVDKSILMRTETDGAVRFRLLETLRSYGRSKIADSDEYGQLRARHYEWYRRLVDDAESDWFSPRQVYWIERLDRELPNLREALEFSISLPGRERLDIPKALQPFWIAHGPISEGRRWLDRALGSAGDPSPQRAKALYAAIMLAALQADLPAAKRWVQEGKRVVEGLSDSTAHALIAIGEAFTSLMCGQLAHARDRLEYAVTTTGELAVRAGGVLMLGWAYELLGAYTEATSAYQRVLAYADSHGEWVFKTNALWMIGLAEWSHGDPAAAKQRFKEGLQLAHHIGDLRMTALFLEALSWVVRAGGEPRLAVMLAAAAAESSRAVGSPLAGFRDYSVHQRECEQRAREALGERQFDAARREGAALSAEEAVAYALGE
jgi:non-specific serine/threonine protein kinase